MLAIIDLDGTVYRAGAAIPGAADGIAALRAAGHETLFLTNRAVHTRDAIAADLQEMGIDAATDDILTSGSLTAAYLADTHPDRTFYVVGEQALVDELTAADVAVTDDPREADGVVASIDRDLTYDALRDAVRILARPDTVFVATNPDETVPGDEGPDPGAGGIVAALEAMAGREATVVGKPSSITTDTVLARTGVDPSDAMMVGDRLNTDMAMGMDAGMTTVLVLTGSTDRDALAAAERQPDHVLDSLADIAAVL